VARKLFVVAVLILAASAGALGFQVLTYLKAGVWPIVSVQSVSEALFGPIPVIGSTGVGAAVRWFGALPVTVTGVALAYLVFLSSDLLRRR
jgi:hypothetical protein